MDEMLQKLTAILEAMPREVYDQYGEIAYRSFHTDHVKGDELLTETIKALSGGTPYEQVAQQIIDVYNSTEKWYA